MFKKIIKSAQIMHSIYDSIVLLPYSSNNIIDCAITDFIIKEKYTVKKVFKIIQNG